VSWSVGFAVLVGLTAVCAVFLWKSPLPALAGETVPSEKEAAQVPQRNDASRGRGRNRGRKQADKVTTAAPRAIAKDLPPLGGVDSDADGPQPLDSSVTFGRRLRWVLLAVVPSSLMLGATTYITTDIAAIPLLWVLPLGLYLLSFIIVFARIPPRVQGVLLAAAEVAACAAVGILLWYVANESGRPFLKGIAAICWAGAVLAWWIARLRDANLLHRAMILLLPVFVLVLTFFMVSEYKPKHHFIEISVALHLATLFVVSMVCHGELARDRPDTGHLTEYFLWMSVGGVVGGLFNALAAPLIFNAIVEYPLALVVACLLLPPLSKRQESTWGRRADVALAGLFLLVGVLLLILRIRDHDLKFQVLARGPWVWELTALLLGLGLGLWALVRSRGNRIDSWLDLALPATLGVLVVGLFWGLYSDVVWPRILRVAHVLHLEPNFFRLILSVALPGVLCYTFIERSLRFGLGLGALFLAAAFSNGVDESVLFQKRSFFGVLKVEKETETYKPEDIAKSGMSRAFLGKTYVFRRLIHGTTMHGKQFLDEDRRDEPLTYYHRSGPIGQVFAAYNTDPKKNYAVIGLGTGTMACYALPGQHVTFYDIDALVRDLSFKEENPQFTYVEEARKRGARVDLVLGDARVQLERQQLAPDQKYSLMVIDAFSSDAIPIHLITRQALELYLDRMTEDGIVCFHVSNRYLRLEPVLFKLKEELHLEGMFESDDREDYPGKARSTWVALARKPEYLSRLTDRLRWDQAQRKKVQGGLGPLYGWPDGGTGLAGLAMLLYGVADEVRPLSEWEPLRESFQLTTASFAKLAVASFELTPKSFQSLAKAGVHDEVLSKLDPLRDTEFTSRERFLEKLAVVLDKDEYAAYRDLLLKEAKGKALVPDEVLAKLDPMRDTEYTSRDLFLEDLGRALNADELARYRDLMVKEANEHGWPDPARVGTWTDDYSNLLSVFMW
jgi:hypothetical protein